jgi:peptidyl-prolyl cis-trans isomerase A (cyclophilin A)
MKIQHWLCLAWLLTGCQTGTEQSPYSQTNTSTSAPVSTPAAPPPAETASPTPEATGTMTPAPSTGKLEPLPGVEAPPIKKVVKARFKTTKGDMLIEIYPEAAPNAAARFQELISKGFYDNTPLFRVVPGFVVQFGVNSKPNHVVYKEKNFDDDPSNFKLSPGTLAFAKAGPNTNSTQVFINFGDNSRLASDEGGHFSAFGKVVKGFEVAQKFKQVGDPSMGLDQDALWSNTDKYLASLPDKPDMIVKAEIIK